MFLNTTNAFGFRIHGVTPSHPVNEVNEDNQILKFAAGQIYHLYNRGNNSQKIFFDRENYIFFLNKIRTHLKPITNVMAYCLMPNHFHLLFYVPEKPEGLQKTHQVA
jgi:REP element-mobilizing transposase RayT